MDYIFVAAKTLTAIGITWAGVLATGLVSLRIARLKGLRERGPRRVTALGST